jgi:hypothetical protein
MTKNDLYSYLIREGIRRDYEVIAEFVVDLKDKPVINKRGKTVHRKMKKVIDVVWATRLGGHEGPQNSRNQQYWQLGAIFEIEGSNIPRYGRRGNGFDRHVRSYPEITNANGQPVQKFVVLYTAAHDRAWDNSLVRTAEVRERQEWGGDIAPVFDGEEIQREIQRRFPLQAMPVDVACHLCGRGGAGRRPSDVGGGGLFKIRRLAPVGLRFHRQSTGFPLHLVSGPFRWNSLLCDYSSLRLRLSLTPCLRCRQLPILRNSACDDRRELTPMVFQLRF